VSLHENALNVLSGLDADDPLRQRFLDLLATGPESVLPNAAGPHLTASALIVDPVRGKVLLCLHGRVRKWAQMGGHCEPGDPTLAAAALREAREESGIDGLTVSAAPIGLDAHPVRCRYGPSEHFDVRYAVLAPPGAVETCSAESAALGWFAPDALPSPLADATESLVAPALAWATDTRWSRAHADRRPRP
jgi:8-oxo-dGTP pyrophosphatase MutT (NUDIX family)